MIVCFLSNISAKYYKNPSMLSRVIAKNVGDVFFETQTLQLQQFSAVQLCKTKSGTVDVVILCPILFWSTYGVGGSPVRPQTTRR